MNLKEVKNFDLTSLCAFDEKKYPFLLESVAGNNNNNFSILFANPESSIVYYGEGDFLSSLDKELSFNQANKEIPFVGGYFVYLSYELAYQLEDSLLDYMQKNSTPIAYAVKISSAIIFDKRKNKTYIVDEHNNDIKIDSILQDIDNSQNISKSSINFKGKLTVDNADIFKKNISTTQKYIIAGDIFQANISRKWDYHLQNKVSAIDVYKALKKSNPAPFAAFANFANFSIISSSPERLFCLNDNIIQTRPIAGTRPVNEDKKQLIGDLKERAEHLMLLDLERNDLGRICKYGTVEVDETMSIENYEFVQHIVSNVKGELRDNTSFANIIKAIFPGGTITGCPKIRSMQIISELEDSARGAYTGSIGYISNNGNMDFNILIRTIIKKKNNLEFRAGAGIVFDSIAEKELLETEYKAQGMLDIIQKNNLKVV